MKLSKTTIANLVSDRPLFMTSLGLVVAMVIYLVVLSLNLHPADTTIYTRYSSFGPGHFYKGSWTNELLFLGLGILTTLLHLLLMVKLNELKRREVALFVGIIGIVILVLACAYALSVASLGGVA